jgi:hypothetical protein
MLVRAGVRPTVLVRDPARMDPAVLERVDAVPVDQRDADAVVAATTGTDALFWVDPPTFADDPSADYALATDATGHPVRAERITDDEMRGLLAGYGMSDGLVEAVMGMSTGMREGFVPEQGRDVTTTTPTTLGSWAYDVLRPLL